MFREFALTQSGQERIVARHNALLTDEAGRHTGTLSSGEDITERRRTEDSLRESEHELSVVFDNAPFIMMILDGEMRIRKANRLANEFICLPADAIGQRSGEALHCIHADDDSDGCGSGPSCKKCILRRTVTDTFETGERLFRVEAKHIFTVGGRAREMMLLFSTTKLTVRNQPSVLLSIQDISEQKKLEGQLRHAQKMEIIGQLVGGIAHDFNNIIATIMGYGEMALMKMAANDPKRLNIDHMLEASDRAAHLTKDLLLFSRKQSAERKPVYLDVIIRNVGKFLIRVLGEDVEFKTIVLEGEMPILADGNQIEQVLMNLATNARDAMPQGGKFIITAEKIELDDEFVAVHGYGRPGRYAMITVTDTGMGIDKETRLKVFEPFFTTKEVGKGTGLGLAVVYSIIKQHDGYINVYSEPGMGTTLKVYLPLVKSAVHREEVTEDRAYPAGGADTILLAEDDESLREMTQSILEEFGYTVITAFDGEDAVKKFMEHKDSIQLLLFDLVMPKKNGKEAYDKIMKIKPDSKIIFLSGYTPDVVRRKISIDNQVLVLSKPISPIDLLKKVRNILDDNKT